MSPFHVPAIHGISVNDLTLTVNDHEAALVATIDFVYGAVFVLKRQMGRFQCNLFFWQSEFEL